jgi:5'-nucleotidase
MPTSSARSSSGCPTEPGRLASGEEGTTALILVTNDDGITSPGLHALSAELKRLGRVIVVAPEAERSAVGHAITTTIPLRIQEFRRGDEVVGFATSGTPADCVKIAVRALLEVPPDLVVSGINRGSNLGTNVIYSGTVSAATEARILGIPSLAISLDADADADWSYAAVVGRRLAAQVLERGLPPGVLLNVNVPNLPAGRVRGFRITRQGSSRFTEEFVAREDPRHRPYYWLTGSYEVNDDDPETDGWAVANGYVSVTPISFDLTAHAARAELASWDLDD